MILRLFFSLVTLTLCLSFTLFGQTNFIRNYGESSKFDATHSIQVTPDGGFILLGGTANNTNGLLDFYLIKTDVDGNEEWSKTYGGARNDDGRQLLVTNDGFLLFGYTESTSNWTQDFYLVKTDFDGNLQWEQTYGGTNDDIGIDLVADGSTGFILVGNSVTDETNGQDILVIRIGEDGTEITSNTLGTIERDQVTSVERLSDGTYALTAQYNNNRLLKLDADLNLLWEAGNGAADVIISLNDVKEMPSGNLLACGQYGGFSGWAMYLTFSPTGAIIEEFSLETENLFASLNSIQPMTDGGFAFLYDSGVEIGLIKTAADLSLSSHTQWTDSNIFNIQNLILHANGNFYTTGMTNFNLGGEDAAFLAISPTDDLIGWQSYGVIAIDDDEFAYAGIETSDGGFVMSGTKTFDLPNGEDIHLVKVDSEGTLLWSHSFGTVLSELGWSVTEATDGGIVAMGSDRDIENGGITVVKTDADGNFQWLKTHLLKRSSIFGGIQATTDGGFIIAASGEYANSTIGKQGIFLLKLDSAGDTLWTRNIDAPQSNFTRAYTVKTSQDGGFIIGGLASREAGTSNGFLDAVLLKTDANGNVEWQNFYQTNDRINRFSTVDENEFGEIAAYGWDWPSSGDFGGFLLKTNAQGDSLLGKVILQPGLESFSGYATWFDEAGGFIVINNGILETPNNLNRNLLKSRFIAISKLDENGDLIWSQDYGFGHAPFVYKGQKTSDGGIAAFGLATYNNSIQFYFIKTAADGILEIETTIPVDDGIQIAPNPTKDEFVYRFENESMGALNLTIFNATGQVVESLKTQKNESTFEHTFNLNSFPSGMYFISLEMNGQRFGRQIVKE